MATRGLSESVLGASDEVLDLQCEICQKKGKQREAKHFCENCNSYMCDACQGQHFRTTYFRQHKISTSMIRNDCGMCLQEGNRSKANHFCKTCNSYICSLCIDLHISFDASQHHIMKSGKGTLRPRYPSEDEDISTPFRQLTTNPSEISNSPSGFPSISKDRKHIRKSSQKSMDPVKDEGEVISSSAGFVDKTARKQIKPLADMTVRKSNKINIKLKNDKWTPSITGCCFIPGGELVLCDHMNSEIKLLDRSLSLKDSLALQVGPQDVTVLDGSNIVVTLPDKEQLQIIQLSPTVKLGRTVPVDMYCNGIAVACGLIYVCGHSTDDASHGKINVYDVDGNFIRRLGVDQNGIDLFSRPWYIAVSDAGDKVFVSDWDNRTVTCLSSDGKVIWRYKDDTLSCPCGIYADCGENVIMCNSSNNIVDIITAKGKRYETSTILSSRYGLNHPQCVTYRPDDQTLVVGCLDKVLYVYSLS